MRVKSIWIMMIIVMGWNVGVHVVHGFEVNGCTICTIFTGLTQQIAIKNAQAVNTVTNNLCSAATIDLPSLTGTCQLVLGFLAPALQMCIYFSITPDDCCKRINLCSSSNTCKLYNVWPPPKSMFANENGKSSVAYRLSQLVKKHQDKDSEGTRNEISEWLSMFMSTMAPFANSNKNHTPMKMGTESPSPSSRFIKIDDFESYINNLRQTFPFLQQHYGGDGHIANANKYFSMEEIDQLKPHFYNVFETIAVHVSELLNLLPSSGSLSGASGASSSNVHLLRKASSNYSPAVDMDGDRFSPGPTSRGSRWRGKDCNDSHASIYPGRKIPQPNPTIDHNCNGIYGMDPSTDTPYEETLCSKSDYRGLIVIGDSATAHFRIPPQYINANSFNSQVYKGLTALINDSFDYPQCSWGTGYEIDAECPPNKLSMISIAQLLRQRNRCNHRDFQNIGVNGADSNDIPPPGIITSIGPRKDDHPVWVILALIGNDVCHRTPSFDAFTTSEKFEQNTLNSLEYLDQVLPPGSYVTLIGLVDGRVLYDTLKNEIHPFGVSYPQFYDYLNCVGSSPCWGWMNTNETVRNITWNEHASVLNQVYEKIASNDQYNNFEVDYIPMDFATISANWKKSGGNAKDLIEPSDGFHPSQTANTLIVREMWDYVNTNLPQILGKTNENNEMIEKLFGNQGGY